MFFLISNVVFGFCGSFFEKRGMLLKKCGRSERVSHGEVTSAEQGSEDIYTRKSCIVLREAWLGGPLRAKRERMSENVLREA